VLRARDHPPVGHAVASQLVSEHHLGAYSSSGAAREKPGCGLRVPGERDMTRISSSAPVLVNGPRQTVGVPPLLMNTSSISCSVTLCPLRPP
jgi:hypothetical protein